MTATPTIPNLWPDDIKVDAVPPLVILKAQAAGLQERTKGVLSADVTTTTGTKDYETHTLYVFAEQLDKARRGILSVTHRAELYPAVIEAKVFELEARKAAARNPVDAILRESFPVPGSPVAWPDPQDWKPIASSQDELVKLFGQVLKSMPVRALLESLLARINEKRLAEKLAAPPAA